MSSISANLAIDDPWSVQGPTPEEVMREYFRRRVKALGRGVVAKLLDETVKNIDHIKRGRGNMKTKHIVAVTDKTTSADLFGALAGVAAEMMVSASLADAATIAAGKQKQIASTGVARRPPAKEAAEAQGHHARQSPGKSRRRSASQADPGSDPGIR